MEMYFNIGFGFLEQTFFPAIVVWLTAGLLQWVMLWQRHGVICTGRFAGQLGAEFLGMEAARA
ncbi:MAG: hypothetical protein IJ049_02675 [Oscillospiraceae bacterium]|nr:hypothetical protein [Oscillospiraceae bacterium]